MKQERKAEISRIHARFMADEVFLSSKIGYAACDPELEDLLRFFSKNGEAFKVDEKLKRYPSIYLENEWRMEFKKQVFTHLINEEYDKSFELTYPIAFVRMTQLLAYGEEDIIKMCNAFNDKYELSYDLLTHSDKDDLLKCYFEISVA